MNVRISEDALDDLIAGYWFHEHRSPGWGDHFRKCLVADVEALATLGGVHEVAHGYHRMTARKFSYAIYYERSGDAVTIVAIVDARRDPLWIRRRLNRPG